MSSLRVYAAVLAICIPRAHADPSDEHGVSAIFRRLRSSGDGAEQPIDKSLLSKPDAGLAAHVVSSVGAPAACGADCKNFNMTILHMNDHHSHLLPEQFTLDAVSSRWTMVKVSYGGYPRLVSLMKKLSRENTNVVKIHAGDAITGTIYFSAFMGEADAAVMKQACFDMVGLGNHEFDEGDSVLAEYIDMLQSQGSPCGEVPVLAANVVPGPESALIGKLRNYTIKTFEGGNKVGFIGIDTVIKVMKASNPDEGTALLDEYAAAQWNIDALQSKGINKIVLVSHIGYKEDLKLAKKLRGIDVIVGADSHTLLSSGDFLTGWDTSGPYPTLVDGADGGQVCVVQAWSFSHLLGELHVEFDPKGAVLNCQGDPRVPFDGSHFDAGGVELDTSDTDAIREHLEASPMFVSTMEDKPTKEALEPFKSQLDTKMATVVAKVPETLCLDRVPGSGYSAICPADRTSKQGSDISNIAAKAGLVAERGADACILNAGAVRADIPAGDLTIEGVYKVLPYPSELVQLTMTGKQIKQVLEDALDYVLVESMDGAYPYAAGLRYKVDASQEQGDRISDLEVNPQVSGEWSAVDPSQVYTVVATEYTAAGKDGYVTFRDVRDSMIETHTMMAQAFLHYLEGIPSLERLPSEDYSTQLYTDEIDL